MTSEKNNDSLRQCYVIAGVSLGVESDGIEEKWENVSGFISSDKKKFLEIQIICKEEKPNILSNAKIIYSDKMLQIIKSKREVFRFYGSSEWMKSLQYTWTSCLHYISPSPDVYNIFFPSAPRSEKDVFNAMCLDLIMAHHHRVILHSSYITYRGEGIVFTAPSGTGKSTQAGLWADTQDDVEIINGDRSILSCDGEIPEVHGLPFCGTSKICRNVSAPLCAAVVLRQGGENRIRRLGAAEAVKLLMSECAVSPWDREGTGNILDLLIRITERIPVYLLSCLPDDSAVRLLRQTLEEDRNRK